MPGVGMEGGAALEPVPATGACERIGGIEVDAISCCTIHTTTLLSCMHCVCCVACVGGGRDRATDVPVNESQHTSAAQPEASPSLAVHHARTAHNTPLWVLAVNELPGLLQRAKEQRRREPLSLHCPQYAAMCPARMPVMRAPQHLAVPEAILIAIPSVAHYSNASLRTCKSFRQGQHASRQPTRSTTTMYDTAGQVANTTAWT